MCYLSHAYSDQNKIRADIIQTQSNNADLLNRALVWNANRVGDAAGRNAVAGMVSGLTGTVPGTHFWNGGAQSWQQFYNSSLASAQTQALKDGKQFSYGAFLTALGNQYPTIFGEAAQKYQDAATTASQQALNTPHPLLMGLAKQNSINPMGLGDLATKYGNDPSKLFSSFTGTPQATLQPKTNTGTPNATGAGGTSTAPATANPAPTFLSGMTAATFGPSNNPMPPFVIPIPVRATPAPAPAVDPAALANYFRGTGIQVPVAPTSTAIPAPSLAQNTFRLLSVPSTTGTDSRFGFPSGVNVNPGAVLTGIATPPSVPATANPSFVLTTANN
ncbi:MAG TPA: hypothetical protein VGY56_10875 [Verrucomicrobiae bacterium]|nr:hypothetical protein [Verrucomicrobiae bacterium]